LYILRLIFAAAATSIARMPAAGRWGYLLRNSLLESGNSPHRNSPLGSGNFSLWDSLLESETFYIESSVRAYGDSSNRRLFKMFYFRSDILFCFGPGPHCGKPKK
jgi:hypothetical protein